MNYLVTTAITEYETKVGNIKAPRGTLNHAAEAQRYVSELHRQIGTDALEAYLSTPGAV